MVFKRRNCLNNLQMASFVTRTINLCLLCFVTNSAYGLSADEAQTYNFTNNALNEPVTTVNYYVNESKNVENAKFENSLSRSNPNLDKRDLIQMNNGLVNLNDDTQVWITPSGAALSVKY